MLRSYARLPDGTVVLQLGVTGDEFERLREIPCGSAALRFRLVELNHVGAVEVWFAGESEGNAPALVKRTGCDRIVRHTTRTPELRKPIAEGGLLRIVAAIADTLQPMDLSFRSVRKSWHPVLGNLGASLHRLHGCSFRSERAFERAAVQITDELVALFRDVEPWDDVPNWLALLTDSLESLSRSIQMARPAEVREWLDRRSGVPSELRGVLWTSGMVLAANAALAAMTPAAPHGPQ